MFYKIALLGSPGSGKSTAGLSFEGVEQNVFGSSEETTALNFIGRSDILPFKKFDWYSCLTPEEQAKFTDEKVSETEIGIMTKKARAKNLAKYRRYIYGLRNDLMAGKRPELKTLLIDNFTPFSQDFQDYVEIIYEKEFITKGGEFNSIAFAIKYQHEVTDFLRMICELPCNVVLTCHVAMAMDEADASKANFLKDTASGIKYAKEWQPLIFGKAKYIFGGIFDYVFFMYTQENPGQATKYIMKLEADDSTVGIAKSRLQPFENPRQIIAPKNEFYKFFMEAIDKKLNKGGK